MRVLVIGACLGLAALAADAARAADDMAGATSRDRLAREVGSARAETLAHGDADAGRTQAAGWLGRWIDANRPGVSAPVSPAEVPLLPPDQGG